MSRVPVGGVRSVAVIVVTETEAGRMTIFANRTFPPESGECLAGELADRIAGLAHVIVSEQGGRLTYEEQNGEVIQDVG